MVWAAGWSSGCGHLVAVLIKLNVECDYQVDKLGVVIKVVTWVWIMWSLCCDQALCRHRPLALRNPLRCTQPTLIPCFHPYHHISPWSFLPKVTIYHINLFARSHIVSSLNGLYCDQIMRCNLHHICLFVYRTFSGNWSCVRRMWDHSNWRAFHPPWQGSLWGGLQGLDDHFMTVLLLMIIFV